LNGSHAKSGLTTPFLMRTTQKAEGRRKKDFSRKGGYQGGFGITEIKYQFLG